MSGARKFSNHTLHYILYDGPTKFSTGSMPISKSEATFLSDHEQFGPDHETTANVFPCFRS